MSKDGLAYQPGFGSHFSSESLPGALPAGQNSPQVCPLGLYAEQLSGTAFTAPRVQNQRSWLYRIRPTVGHTSQEEYPHPGLCDSENLKVTPNQIRWAPMRAGTLERGAVDFVDGMATMSAAGDAGMHEGLAIHMYFANRSMGSKRAFQNSDGDFLIVPQQGRLFITTEFGKMEVGPQEICVIQRGIKFNVSLPDSYEDDGKTPKEGDAATARGYILEIFTGHFELPNLGPIGANGLANPRDFLHPVASYEDVDCPDNDYQVVNKFGGKCFSSTMDHSPFDVVAWHGNYTPYKYDLRLFNTMNSVSFDHPDPSIYTVLTCQSAVEGTAVADFVIFPPRFMVMDHSFRPPYYHRNCMTEFMGMVYGKYDAKKGFAAGGASLHSCMSAHGPDAATFKKASEEELKPVYFDGGLAFMFETCYTMKLSPWALASDCREVDYVDCWKGLPKLFTGPPSS